MTIPRETIVNFTINTFNVGGHFIQHKSYYIKDDFFDFLSLQDVFLCYDNTLLFYGVNGILILELIYKQDPFY